MCIDGKLWLAMWAKGRGGPSCTQSTAEVSHSPRPRLAAGAAAEPIFDEAAERPAAAAALDSDPDDDVSASRRDRLEPTAAAGAAPRPTFP